MKQKLVGLLSVVLLTGAVLGMVGCGASGADEAESEATESASEDVDAELKAFLDSYEDYVDEYVAFMKKYNADPANAVSMINEYSDMMAKYADFEDKVKKYDVNEMSAADAAYYTDVTSRCSKKILDVMPK
ncbi:MAG: hypothetical protein K6G07_02025 [Lachnospiraceae bacterium]|nr:hypothetical protein [Lachnospiraceae bacterium]